MDMKRLYILFVLFGSFCAMELPEVTIDSNNTNQSGQGLWDKWWIKSKFFESDKEIPIVVSQCGAALYPDYETGDDALKINTLDYSGKSIKVDGSSESALVQDGIFSPDGKYFVFEAQGVDENENSEFRIIDMKSGKVVDYTPSAVNEAVNFTFDFMPSGDFVFCSQNKIYAMPIEDLVNWRENQLNVIYERTDNKEFLGLSNSALNMRVASPTKILVANPNLALKNNLYGFDLLEKKNGIWEYVFAVETEHPIYKIVPSSRNMCITQEGARGSIVVFYNENSVSKKTIYIPKLLDFALSPDEKSVVCAAKKFLHVIDCTNPENPRRVQRFVFFNDIKKIVWSSIGMAVIIKNEHGDEDGDVRFDLMLDGQKSGPKSIFDMLGK